MRSQRLTGFTLFEHHGRGHQMSTRRDGESGWSVTIIPDEQAAVILSMIETSGHPDGPWSVVRGCSAVEARARLTEAFDGLA